MKVRYNFYIEQEKLKKLKYIALNEDTSISAITNTLLDEYIEQAEREGEKQNNET